MASGTIPADASVKYAIGAATLIDDISASANSTGVAKIDISSFADSARVIDIIACRLGANPASIIITIAERQTATGYWLIYFRTTTNPVEMTAGTQLLNTRLLYR